MSNLNDNERLHLDKMIKEFDAADNTNKIQSLRHSRKIKDNVEKLLNLKKKYSRMMLIDRPKFDKLLISHCNFLWNNYTNIFNRLLKDEIDVNILYAFVEKLREIEDGETDQHDASVEVGKILKRVYIDSALRREKNYESTGDPKPPEREPRSELSWSKYKSLNLP